MKKKIKDLTLEEVANICKKCDDNINYDCPFYNVYIVDCQNGKHECNDEIRRTNFEKEIEVE